MEKRLCCPGCKFYAENDVQAQTLKRSYLCVRFPPIVSYLSVNNAIANVIAYPTVSENTFRCGEFAPVPAVTLAPA